MSTSPIDPDLRIRATWGPELHAAYDRFQHFEPHASKVLEFLQHHPLDLAEALVKRFSNAIERRRIERETAQLKAETDAHRAVLGDDPPPATIYRFFP